MPKMTAISHEVYSHSIIIQRITNLTGHFLQADCILADFQTMTGEDEKDHEASILNTIDALEFSKLNLSLGGSFFCRYARGRHDSALVSEAEKFFNDVVVIPSKVSIDRPAQNLYRSMTHSYMLCRDKKITCH
jgi:23S rRNA U2552 (ribose-2'-O)-methylase RlmE/FtsJ